MTKPMEQSTRSLKSVGLLLRALLPTLLTVSLSYGATYWVAINGNNSNNGTKASPWSTIQNAIDQAKPGDSILVAPGTYAENVKVKTTGSANA